MEMESHEENLHNMIKISKMETAKDQARDAARSIRERQRDMQKMGVPTGMGGGSSNDNNAGWCLRLRPRFILSTFAKELSHVYLLTI